MKRILCAVPVLMLAGLAACSHLSSEQRAGPVRIALVSDTHTTRGTNGEQPMYRARLDKVIGAVNECGADFVVITGDLTEDGKQPELEDFAKQIKGFKAPVLYVPGNHDLGNKIIPGKGGSVSVERAERYEQALGPTFFARDVKGVRVIGVNSPVFGSGFEIIRDHGQNDSGGANRSGRTLNGGNRI